MKFKTNWSHCFFLLSKRKKITNYIISSVMHALWLVLTYDLLEDRLIDDVIIKTFFNSLCGKNIGDTLGCTSCATFLLLLHFDIICDLLLNRHMAPWNLFVKLSLKFSNFLILCSVINHWCIYHILTSSVSYYCTDPRQHGNCLCIM